jgi:hypothetical protein
MAQQGVEKAGKKHNWARTGRMALYGGGKQNALHVSRDGLLCPKPTFRTDSTIRITSRVRSRRNDMV